MVPEKMPCYLPVFLSETGKMCQSQQYTECHCKMVPCAFRGLAKKCGVRGMRDDIYHLYSAVELAFTL